MTGKEELKRYQREYQRKYRQENREKLNAYAREWRKSNPDKMRAIAERYWAKKEHEGRKIHNNGELSEVSEG